MNLCIIEILEEEREKVIKHAFAELWLKLPKSEESHTHTDTHTHTHTHTHTDTHTQTHTHRHTHRDTHTHTDVYTHIYKNLPGSCIHGILQEYQVGSHSLLQRILLTQQSNLGLVHCRQMLYHLNHQGSL